MRAVGVLAALVVEARCLGPAAGSIGEGLRLRVTGMGRAAAEEGAHALTAAGVTGLLSWGTAGGLEPGAEPGAVVVPRWVQGAGGERYRCHPPWGDRVANAVGHRLPVSRGDLMEVTRVLRTPEEKEALRRRAGASAADLESAAVARVAAGAGLPFVAVRAVVDPAGEVLPWAAVAAIDPRGRTRLLRLLKGLLRRPGEFPGLIRTALHFRRARRSLREVARKGGRQLGLPEAEGPDSSDP